MSIGRFGSDDDEKCPDDGFGMGPTSDEIERWNEAKRRVNAGEGPCKYDDEMNDLMRQVRNRRRE